MQKYRKFLDEPNMSDKTLLVSVEDLIYTAFGTGDQNVLNFKLLQTVLHILARQMRLLEQGVEIKLDDLGIDGKSPETYETGTYAEEQVTPSSSATSKDEAAGREGRDDGDDRDERDYRGEEGGVGGKGKRGDKTSSKDRDDRGGSKDRDKAEKGGSKDRKGDKGASKEKGADKGGSKEKGADKGGSKERGADKSGAKQKGADKGSKDRDKGKKGDRGGTGGDRDEDRDDERGGQSAERGGGRGKDRDERGGGRGKDRDERGGGRGKDRDERGGGRDERGGGRDERGGGRDERGGGRDERGGGRDERSGGRGQDRGGTGVDRDEDRGGERGAERGGERDTERGGGRGGEQGKKGKDRGADKDRRGTPESGRSGVGSQGRGAVREGSRTSITVTETERKGGKGPQDKILVVEKGPSSRPGGRPARVGSIEVVTASQFALLEKAVNQLMTVTGPLPVPALPDNEKLRKDLAKGTASLTETMQAMQLNARVQAAEEGLTRMAGLLTQLAAAGALPAGVRADLQLAARPAAAAPGSAAPATAAPATVTAGTAAGGTAATGFAPFGTAGAGTVAGLGAGTVSTTMTGAATARPGAMESASQAGTGLAGAGLSSTVTGAPGSGRKSVAIDPMTAASTITSASSRPDTYKRGATEATSGSISRGSVAGRASLIVGAPTVVSTGSGAIPIGVTHPEMDDVLQIMKEDLLKEITTMTTKATHSSEVASNTSKSVADKLDIALKLDKRITKLFSQTADYAEQLSGFDSGLTTQMASFQEQMSQMRNDLKGGLTQLELANNNAETAALVELTERYESLVIELDNTMHLHQSLTALQKELSDEVRSLVECVEMLREQKADRDEVFDGLRDKADITRLSGLLHEEDFAHARVELEKRLDLCYEKFKKQDRVWLGAIQDLTAIAQAKGEIIQLMAIKDNATEELRNIQQMLRKLFIMLGEPKAAVLMRKLAAGAVCGSCLVPALMEPREPAAGGPAQPYALPPLRAPPDGPCLAALRPLPPPDTRRHVCRRWVGGSHTLMADNVTHEKAGASQIDSTPTKRYTGYGTDGKLYMLEEELLPCLECNKMSTDEPEPGSTPLPTPVGGGGDQAAGQPAEKNFDDRDTEEKK